MTPVAVVKTAAPIVLAAVLSLVGEGRAVFSREFKTFNGPLKISVAIKIERGEKKLEWQETHS